MSDLFTSLRLFALSLVICSAVYPVAVLTFASVVVPEKRQGSLILDDRGTVVGSRLLAQSFTKPEYFWPRPSAPDYDASATGGSNLSPTNPKITERAREIIKQLEPADGQRVPVELVLASGSGMDPHISLSAAEFQVPRVAKARRMPDEQVRQLIRQHTDSPTLTVLGSEPLVNVLELNFALNRQPR